MPALLFISFCRCCFFVNLDDFSRIKKQTNKYKKEKKHALDKQNQEKKKQEKKLNIVED